MFVVVDLRASARIRDFNAVVSVVILRAPLCPLRPLWFGLLLGGWRQAGSTAASAA